MSGGSAYGLGALFPLLRSAAAAEIAKAFATPDGGEPALTGGDQAARSEAPTRPNAPAVAGSPSWSQTPPSADALAAVPNPGRDGAGGLTFASLAPPRMVLASLAAGFTRPTMVEGMRPDHAAAALRASPPQTPTTPIPAALAEAMLAEPSTDLPAPTQRPDMKANATPAPDKTGALQKPAALGVLAPGQPASGQPVSGQAVSGQQASGPPASGQPAFDLPASGLPAPDAPAVATAPLAPPVSAPPGAEPRPTTLSPAPAPPSEQSTPGAVPLPDVDTGAPGQPASSKDQDGRPLTPASIPEIARSGRPEATTLGHSVAPTTDVAASPLPKAEARETPQAAAGADTRSPTAATRDPAMVSDPSPHPLAENRAQVAATAPSSSLSAPLPAALGLSAALAPALAEAVALGGFPLTTAGQGASAASLVIFNAAMIPSWPPAFRLDETGADVAALRAGGADMAQMSPEEAAEYLTKMAAAFGFLLTVKKRLSKCRKEEKEILLGLFSFLGVALDTLAKGLQMALDLTADQREMLAELALVQGDDGGRPPHKGRQRLRL